MQTQEIFEKSYSERLLKIAKKRQTNRGFKKRLFSILPTYKQKIMEIITWFKELPKNDKPYWVFILIAFVYFIVQVAIGVLNY